MKVIIELEVENCSDCPNYKYEGTSWSEDVYTCKKLNCEVDGKGIPSNCPFIESTMEKLRQLAVISKRQRPDRVTYNDWVYEKVCLDELSN